MAKAKKSESSSESSKPAAKKKAPATAPAKKGASSAGGSPAVNTDFAAQSAARMLMARKSGAQLNTTSDKKESSAFKAMKDNLAKPHMSSMDNMLNSTATPGANKSNVPQQNQKGRNQTYSADVTRTGVPRRNPG